MKFQNKRLNVALLSAVFVMMCFVASNAQDRATTFSVYNRSPSQITKIMVNIPGEKTWRALKIGSGIAANDYKLVKWDDLDYDQPCVEWIVGYYPDGGKTKVVRADLCKKDASVNLYDAAAPEPAAVGAATQRSKMFNVVNSSPSKIIKIMLNVPGEKTWRALNVGAGVPAGDVRSVKWDDQDYDQPCVQWVVGYYPDGGKTKVVKTNLCEKDAFADLYDAATP
jgi:hypothetical protein